MMRFCIQSTWLIAGFFFPTGAVIDIVSLCADLFAAGDFWSNPHHCHYSCCCLSNAFVRSMNDRSHKSLVVFPLVQLQLEPNSPTSSSCGFVLLCKYIQIIILSLKQGSLSKKLCVSYSPICIITFDIYKFLCKKELLFDINYVLFLHSFVYLLWRIFTKLWGM